MDGVQLQMTYKKNKQNIISPLSFNENSYSSYV